MLAVVLQVGKRVQVMVLVEVTPAQFNHVFFTNSGSEANDTNLRLVHRYYDLLGKPDKKHIISRKNAYHGSTIAAASLGGMSAMHKQTRGLDYVHHINQPHWFEEGGDDSPEAFGIRVARDLETKIEELGEDQVAAFIAEPVQGAGGVIIPPDSYWPEIKRICDERDILLIMDEVICGFGRTGNWFGSQSLNIKPHTITMAKAITSAYMPLGAVTVSEDVFQALIDESRKLGMFAHGFTYSGHPVASAVAVKTLEIYERIDLVGHVQKVAPRFNQRLTALADHPLVGEARGIGLIGAVELVRNKAGRQNFAPSDGVGVKAMQIAEEEGLICRAVAGDNVALCPPLVIEEAQIDEMFDALGRILDRTAHWVESGLGHKLKD